MRKLRTIILSIAFLIVLLPASADSGIPRLPNDPSVVTGCMDNGISYAVSRNSTIKGTADVVILQRMCQDVKRLSFKHVAINKEKWSLDTLLSRTVRLVSDSIKKDSLLYGTDNQYIIISGDLDPKKTEASLKKYAGGIKKSDCSIVYKDYEWNPQRAASCSVKDLGKGRTYLEFEFRRRRMSEELLSTVVPLVSMRMDSILKIYLEKSLRTSFRRSGIVFSDLEFACLRSWNHSGDEIYRLSVRLAEEDTRQAYLLIRDFLNELTTEGIPQKSLALCDSEVLGNLKYAAYRPVSVEADLERCISHFIYGTSIVNPSEAYKFFATKNVADSTQQKSLQKYAGEIFAGLENCSPGNAYEESSANAAESHIRPYYVNLSDTLYLPKALKKKAKPVSVGSDYLMGGTKWTFENGISVIYKRMPTHGQMFYSWVLNYGALDVKDAACGEYNFYPELFACAPVDSYVSYGFGDFCEACGIKMSCDVNLYDMAIYGICPSSRTQLLMSVLRQLTEKRVYSRDASGYALDCERISITEEEEVMAELYNSLHPSYSYGSSRQSSALNNRSKISDNAESLFSKAFSHMDDGVLILIGDIHEDEVLKVLRQNVDAFRVGGKLKKNRSVPFMTIAGTVEREMEGPEGAYVEMSAALPYTADNYFASYLLEKILRDRLSAYAAEVNVNLHSRPSEHIDIRISSSLAPDSDCLLAPLRDIAKTANAPEGFADLCLSSSRYQASLKQYPEFWMLASRLRQTDAKDIASQSEAKVKAMAWEKVRYLAQQALSGGKVILETK